VQKAISVDLSQPIEYAKGGELEAGTFITMDPPSSRNMTECAALKQAFFRALPKDGTVETDDTDSNSAEITGEAIMTLITMSKDVELGTVLLLAKELLTSGVAKVEGEVKLTKPLFDNLSQDDVELLVGEYMANFILASALQRLKKS